MLSNHQHTVDAVVVHAASARAGIDHVRYVAKEELLKGLELWRSMVAGGFPFINRENGDQAIAAIEGKSALACAEGGSMGIFPEGTRFRGRKPGSEYEFVNPPRPKGFLAIVRAMLRERPGEGVYILNETFAWQTLLPETGKHMFAGSHFIGARLIIKAEVVGPFHDEVAAHAWLLEEWRRKDAFLGSLES
jgi:1-acyl-sn-glycerol-3-phosphate acyltransferase